MNKDNSFKSIAKIFTTDDTTEMRRAFKDLLVKQFESDLEQMDTFLFDSNKVEEWIEDAYQEVIAEIKIEFKEKLREQMLKLFESNDIETILSLNKKVN
jgi:Fe-S cluster assembly iron-binding protein IscA